MTDTREFLYAASLRVDAHVHKSNIRVSKLAKGAVLRIWGSEPQFAHFLISGAASTSIQLSGGRHAVVKISTQGDLLETAALLGLSVPKTLVTVLLPAEAVRVPFDLLRRVFEQDPALRKRIHHQLGRQMIEVEQNVICNQFHLLGARFARLLLNLQDHCSPSISLTQAELAEQLGSRRSSVAISAGAFRRQGLIAFKRGKIQIPNRVGLEAVACECYRTISSIQSAGTAQDAGDSRDNEPTPYVGQALHDLF